MVGSVTAIMAGLAMLVAAVAGISTRNRLAAILLGILASQAFFFVVFGPVSIEEMLFPAAYSIVPALIGALVGAIVGKRRGSF